jgi:hypothetical protein
MLMCTHPCSTHQTTHPQVVYIATTAQEKMKPWKETSRSSKITTSSRRGLAETPSRLPVKAACIYVSFPHFDYCKDYVDVSDIWCNRILFPFYIMIWALCDDVQLCNWCVRELLILARTWFAFGLPSKTECDIYTPNPPPGCPRCTTTGQVKMKSWRRTSRSSKSTMSSRRGLAANP